MYRRLLDLRNPLKTKSHFLFGARATGKSWLIRNQLQEAHVFDLLNTDTFDRFLKRPHSLAEEIRSNLVVIDEIQKLPRLLDEVHRLIEEKKIRFLLTGSSARKLRAGGGNLLAGRARSLQLFPLTSREIEGFDLLQYCNRGGLPMIYPSDDAWADLRSYVQLYLREEIVAEAVVRKIDHYARFLDTIGAHSGEELNYQNIARDSGVPPRTVDNFVEILKDTLLAFELEPFRKTKKRKALSRSKLYMFDVGVANFLASRKEVLPRSEAFGRAFEHFIIQEIRAYAGYRQLDLPLRYWRTLHNPVEVDCILGDALAIEIKAFESLNDRALGGLKALQEEKKIKRYILVSRDPVRRKVGQIEAIPYNEFLDQLWGDEFI